MSSAVEHNISEKRASIEEGCGARRRSTRGAEDRGCKDDLLPKDCRIYVRSNSGGCRDALLVEHIRGHPSNHRAAGKHDRGGLFSICRKGIQNVCTDRETRSRTRKATRCASRDALVPRALERIELEVQVRHGRGRCVGGVELKRLRGTGSRISGERSNRRGQRTRLN